ncbi:MAG: hypothetical protein LBJ32_00380 [Oscillospiraceae bacterium]|nr:hypothetical protein [Oscillospiraceae bacterium]
MTILEELNQILKDLQIPVETGYFDSQAPDQYSVLTPMSDDFQLFADDLPQQDVKNVRISIFTKNNYLDLKRQLEILLLKANFTITQRYYVEFEPETKYHHYSVDVSKNFNLEE